MGHLHDDAILLLRSESFRYCFLVQVKALVIKTSLGLSNVKYERKIEKDSSRSSKITHTILYFMHIILPSSPANSKS